MQSLANFSTCPDERKVRLVVVTEKIWFAKRRCLQMKSLHKLTIHDGNKEKLEYSSKCGVKMVFGYELRLK